MSDKWLVHEEGYHDEGEYVEMSLCGPEFDEPELVGRAYLNEIDPRELAWMFTGRPEGVRLRLKSPKGLSFKVSARPVTPHAFAVAAEQDQEIS